MTDHKSDKAHGPNAESCAENTGAGRLTVLTERGDNEQNDLVPERLGTYGSFLPSLPLRFDDHVIHFDQTTRPW